MGPGGVCCLQVWGPKVCEAGQCNRAAPMATELRAEAVCAARRCESRRRSRLWSWAMQRSCSCYSTAIELPAEAACAA